MFTIYLHDNHIFKNSILTRTEVRENNVLVFAQSHTVRKQSSHSGLVDSKAHIIIFRCLYSKQDLFNREIVQGIAARPLLKFDKSGISWSDKPV